MGKFRLKLSDENIQILDIQKSMLLLDRKAYLTLLILFQDKEPIKPFKVVKYPNNNTNIIELFISDFVKEAFNNQLNKYKVGKTQYFLNLLRNYSDFFDNT